MRKFPLEVSATETTPSRNKFNTLLLPQTIHSMPLPIMYADRRETLHLVKVSEWSVWPWICAMVWARERDVDHTCRTNFNAGQYSVSFIKIYIQHQDIKFSNTHCNSGHCYLTQNCISKASRFDQGNFYSNFA